MDQTTAVRPTDGDRPILAGYRFDHLIGEGGMGRVYAAEDLLLGRRVAIKLIGASVAENTEALARFEREARMLATIEHPNIVRVYSFGRADAVPYLVMEHIAGETLAARIARGPIPVSEALRITRAVAEALDAAWDHQIVHRDIKPSNLLIDRQGGIHVADFGLAKPLTPSSTDGITVSGLLVGTAHYISPEQAEGKSIDFRSDIYSLGIVLFEMLTGERPFRASTPVGIIARHLREPLPPLPDAIERSHRALAALLREMTAKSAEDRPRSYRALIERIDATERPPTRAIRSRWIGITTAAGVLIAALLIASRSPAPKQTAPAKPPAPAAPTYVGEPISFALENAEIRDVLARFTQVTRMNFIVDNDVQGSVSVHFESVPWDQALEAFLQQNGLTSVVEGNVIRVARLDTLLAEKEKERRLRELRQAERR